MSTGQRALVIGAGTVIGILALAGIAAAATKDEHEDGGGGPEPEVSPHTEAACNEARAQRTQYKAAISQINAQLVDVDAALMGAYQNGDEAAAANLESIKANMVLSRNNYQKEVNALDAYISECP